MYQPSRLPNFKRGLVIAIASFIITTGTSMAASIGGKLEIEDYGSFFVNGRTVKSNHPGASLVTGAELMVAVK